MQLTSDTKFVIGILLVTIIVIAGGAYITSTKSQNIPVQTVPDSLTSRLVRDDAPRMGASDAKVTFVEFVDFECPVCGSVHPIIKELQEAYKDRSVRFVFRNFPLSQHKNAFMASEAAMEAHNQNKFWEYNNVLFENQTSLAQEDLVRYAEALGLNSDLFKQALENHTWENRVREDITDGNALSVQGTPTIFINNIRYTGKYSFEDFAKIIDEQLNS